MSEKSETWTEIPVFDSLFLACIGVMLVFPPCLHFSVQHGACHMSTDLPLMEVCPPALQLWVQTDVRQLQWHSEQLHLETHVSWPLPRGILAWGDCAGCLPFPRRAEPLGWTQPASAEPSLTFRCARSCMLVLCS